MSDRMPDWSLGLFLRHSLRLWEILKCRKRLTLNGPYRLRAKTQIVDVEIDFEHLVDLATSPSGI